MHAFRSLKFRTVCEEDDEEEEEEEEENLFAVINIPYK